MGELRPPWLGQTDLVIDALDPATRDKLCNRARSAIMHAGDIAMRYFGRDVERWEKSPGQIVTRADLEIDEFLKESLPDAGEGWLSEETEDDPSRLDCDRLWIVDPIDGTRSFAAGNPEFAISIAYIVNGKPVLGWLLNPASNELLEACRGEGSRLNGEPVLTSGRSGLDGADLVVSSGENRSLDLATSLQPGIVRPLGSLAYKLLNVASGKSDGYVTYRSIHDWDLAAGILAVEEAGGKVSDTTGQSIRLNQSAPRHHGLVASGSPLFKPLLGITRKHLPAESLAKPD